MDHPSPSGDPAPPDRPEVGDGDVAGAVRRAGEASWWFVGLALVVAGSAWVIWQVRIVLAPLLLAGLVVLVLGPAVAHLARRGLPRFAATSIAYVAVLVPMGVGGFLLTGVLVDQADDLADLWPEVWSQMEGWADDLDDRLERLPFDVSLAEMLNALEDGDWAGDAVRHGARLGLGALGAVLAWVIGVVMAFYLLVDLPRAGRRLVALLPPTTRDHLLPLWARIRFGLAGFIRGQLLIAAMVGFMTAVGLWAIGLPSWLLLGLIAGLGNLVPFLGPIVGGIPAVLIALTTRDVATALWAAGVMVVVQQVESYVLSPLVLRRTARLHPVLAMMSIVLGASLFGIAGVVLAVPAVLTLQIVGGYVWRVFVLGQDPAAVVAIVPGPPDRDGDAPAAAPASSAPTASGPAPGARDP